MSQFNAPVRRAGGSLDVYAGLLFVAVLMLTAGVIVMALRNTQHSQAGNNGAGGVFTLVPTR